jgi:hypothetical protein
MHLSVVNGESRGTHSVVYETVAEIFRIVGKSAFLVVFKI